MTEIHWKLAAASLGLACVIQWYVFNNVVNEIRRICKRALDGWAKALELEAAAESVLAIGNGDEVRELPYSTHADMVERLAVAYARERDATLVDEAWLQENHDGPNLMTVKEYQIGRCVTWLQEGEWVADFRGARFRNPTRGLLLTLKRIVGDT